MSRVIYYHRELVTIHTCTLSHSNSRAGFLWLYIGKSPTSTWAKSVS